MKLKPCPFCGVSLPAVDYEPHTDCFSHPQNGCYESGIWLDPEDFDRWNKRDHKKEPDDVQTKDKEESN